MNKLLLSVVLLVSFSGPAFSGCLDGLSTTATITSTIRGFYINPYSSDESNHNVILDKSTCFADSSGDVTLGSITSSGYYLRFQSKDKTLFASLLSAEARDIKVKFRLKPTSSPDSVNEIAYILTPSNVLSQ